MNKLLCISVPQGLADGIHSVTSYVRSKYEKRIRLVFVKAAASPLQQLLEGQAAGPRMPIGGSEVTLPGGLGANPADVMAAAAQMEMLEKLSKLK